MCGGGMPFIPFGYNMEWNSQAGPMPYSPWYDINPNNLSDRAAYLAMRNSDGRKAYCAYCGGRATFMDGENCPKCGATEVEMK